MQRRAWTREEILLVINLYCKIPFGKMDHRNSEVIWLANLIKRSSNSVALKLGNIASIDPDLRRKGLTNYSKLDKMVWDEFNSNRLLMFYECEKILAQYLKKPIEDIAEIDLDSIPKGKTERESFIRSRVNQNFFRKTVLASYDFKCCVTGLNIPQMLIASHIVPWAEDKENRLNPRNGLCLNALHDKAFDAGFITLSDDLKVIVSSTVKSHVDDDAAQKLLLDYNGYEIDKPTRFIPDTTFLKYHRENIFENFV